MKFSIIINTHNQHSYIDRCLKSCINQNTKIGYEIILVDTSDTNQVESKNYPGVNIINYKTTSKHPCTNQLISIKKGFDQSKGEIICLLDGDDFFNEKKIEFLSKNLIKKEFLNQDIYTEYHEATNKNKIIKKKIYKNNFLFKKFFNNWPEVYSTSCITVSRNLLTSFYKEINFKNWNFLAIDALLVLYADKFKNNYFVGKNLTYKSFHNFNLDKRYSKILSNQFWLRRLQQHEYYKYINSKINYFNIDYFFTKIFSN